jgi:alanine dehydrogenase
VNTAIGPPAQITAETILMFCVILKANGKNEGGQGSVIQTIPGRRSTSKIAITIIVFDVVSDAARLAVQMSASVCTMSGNRCTMRIRRAV